MWRFIVAPTRLGVALEDALAHIGDNSSRMHPSVLRHELTKAARARGVVAAASYEVSIADKCGACLDMLMIVASQFCLIMAALIGRLLI